MAGLTSQIKYQIDTFKQLSSGEGIAHIRDVYGYAIMKISDIGKVATVLGYQAVNERYFVPLIN